MIALGIAGVPGSGEAAVVVVVAVAVALLVSHRRPVVASSASSRPDGDGRADTLQTHAAYLSSAE
jgi:hypothetical protein